MAKAVCLCVCVIRSLLCATDSPYPLHFPPLLPICWNTLFLSSVTVLPLTLGFSLLIYYFEQLPGLATWAHFVSLIWERSHFRRSS